MTKQHLQSNYINPNQSKKGKLPLAESMWALEHLSRVSEQSKAKGYEPMNWLKPEIKCYFVSYLISAALRHIEKFSSGEDYNVEKTLEGQVVVTEFDVLHLESAAYNLLMAAHLFRKGRKDLDDRINKTSPKNPNLDNIAAEEVDRINDLMLKQMGKITHFGNTLRLEEENQKIDNTSYTVGIQSEFLGISDIYKKLDETDNTFMKRFLDTK